VSDRHNKIVVFADTDSGGIIHVANIKGGVGKSTVATNLAAALSKRGPTLLIDLDVQGSATHALGRTPAEFGRSTWEMFRRRFALPEASRPSALSLGARLNAVLGRLESHLVPFVVGKGEVTSLAVRIQSCLDLLPANSDLFKNVNLLHRQNFLYNLQLCRYYYKYIILDTPSIWNTLARTLFLNSDLNLVPVTLNALSTKSLQDYLLNIKKLAHKHPGVRIRVVKNEVFGRQNSAIKGKTRTMSENRRFLESLCEQVVIRTEGGASLLPQSILFDLEIPESAIVRDAQDEGKPVHEFQQYAAVTKAFEKLAKGVQYVLNNPVQSRRRVPLWRRYQDKFLLTAKIAASTAVLALFTVNHPVVHTTAPRPIAPQQLGRTGGEVLSHTFTGGESIYKMAKYAICRFRAVVPSIADVNAYAAEVVDIHNQTRMPGEKRIGNLNDIPVGTTINFYPPSNITNPKEKQLVPVYQYFSALVKDPQAYFTGDWCERGTGGGTPHYGLDVAGNLGAQLLAPMDGTVYVRNSVLAGHTLGIVNSNTVIFYCHMDKRYFKDGARITKGTPVGTIGMTGKTSGPHVHIGYGIRAPKVDGVQFGGAYYKLTDPKLFFYRERFLDQIE
jgi:cellulose biosynthesis protein BcsQ